MLRLHKNKKGQSLLEYALLIALVVAAIIAMQLYAQRSIQARIFDSSGTYLQGKSGAIVGATKQYEPYYVDTNYTTTRATTDNVELTDTTSTTDMDDNRIRVGQSDMIAPAVNTE